MMCARAIVPFAAIALTAATTGADPLPPGSIGLLVGANAGTGPDANALGLGPTFGAQATWQPMATEQRVGLLGFKLTALFGQLYLGDAGRVSDPLRTLQFDLMYSMRIRPGANPSRYLTLRVGGTLLRTDQEIPPNMNRAYAGAIASVGLDQHAFGLLFNVDVRYSMLGARPGMLGLVFGISKTGP
ncbi:MAG: hypothetical protein SFX73_40440 [Kofleriaceae bacterium]|nr:hypothetical protein [Kofleriaceae bacterium]